MKFLASVQCHREKITHDGYVHDKEIDKDEVKTFFKGVRKNASDREEKKETDSEEKSKAEWEQGKAAIKKSRDRQR